MRGSFIHHTWMPRRFLCLSQIFGIGNLGRKGRSQNVQVQAQGYLIRREDYIAVTRVGLGGWLDRNRPRPASLPVAHPRCTISIRNGSAFKSHSHHDQAMVDAQSLACTIPDRHHLTCDVTECSLHDVRSGLKDGYVCLESDLKPRVDVIPSYHTATTNGVSSIIE